MDAKHRAEQVSSVPTALPFHAVLLPHRSLSQPGFLIVMGVLGAVSFVAGIAFTLIGAWPVFGFFGLDVALVYIAFKLNYRAARATETIDVTRDDMTITQVSANGKQRRVTRMNPTWTRLETREWPDGSVDLALTTHGRSTPIARHLGSEERRGFAIALRAALRLVREPIWPT